MTRKIVLLILLISCMSFVSHKFYVSISQVVLNDKNQQLEISLKVFTDDLQIALKQINDSLRIDDQTSIDNYQPLIEAYILENFSFYPTLPITYVGAEIDYDVVWIYLETTPVDKKLSYELSNSVFMDIYQEQVNIVNISIADNTLSYLFQSSKQKQAIAL
jgi:uncharacterized protein YlxP (DUF503 family)